MVSSRTQSPISGRFSTISIRFATSRLAIRLQTSCGVVDEQQRPRLQPELLEARQHDRRRGAGRQPQRQQRHQRSRRPRRCSRPPARPRPRWRRGRTPRDASPASSRSSSDRKVADLGAARRHRPDRKADRACRAATASRTALQSSRVIQTEPRTASTFSSPAARRRRDLQRLAHREQRHRQRRDLDAVEQIRHAEGQPRLPGLQVDADQPERQPEERARSARAAPNRRTPPRR